MRASFNLPRCNHLQLEDPGIRPEVDSGGDLSLFYTSFSLSLVESAASEGL